jgi:SAM-dependent methyltransferase
VKDPDPLSTAASEGIANQYDNELARGLSLSGEDRAYFAAGRLKWLGVRLRKIGCTPDTVMDFGCGAGSTVPHIIRELGAGTVVGIDVSESLLEQAVRQYGSESVRFVLRENHAPTASVDLAYCNGVFHHIDMGHRTAAARYIHDSLRPGGYFSFWENNPWNPGTRLVMSRIAFDREAVPLSSSQARVMLREAGFDVVRTDFLFVFPRPLALFRWLEPCLVRFPLGAQYQVLCRKG